MCISEYPTAKSTAALAHDASHAWVPVVLFFDPPNVDSCQHVLHGWGCLSNAPKAGGLGRLDLVPWDHVMVLTSPLI